MFCSQVRLREIVKKMCSISRDKRTDKIEMYFHKYSPGQKRSIYGQNLHAHSTIHINIIQT